jgi:hypothetical protein
LETTAIEARCREGLLFLSDHAQCRRGTNLPGRLMRCGLADEHWAQEASSLPGPWRAGSIEKVRRRKVRIHCHAATPAVTGPRRMADNDNPRRRD